MHPAPQHTVRWCSQTDALFSEGFAHVGKCLWALLAWCAECTGSRMSGKV